MMCYCSIDAKAQMNANFSADVTAGCAPLIVNFKDLSTGNITSWAWDFGNGNSSIIQHSGTFYLNPGAYTVKLVVTNSAGKKDSIIKPYYISSYSAPISSLKADQTSGCAPLNVKFNDLSVPQSVPITSWYWNLGDGTSSNKQNPQHTYQSNGNFTVTLSINDANGCQSFSYIDKYIHVVSPKADFDMNISNCSAPANCQFMNKSIGNGMNFIWDFGDGTSSTSTSPSHSYSLAGNYNIKLICTDQNGCKDSIQKTIGVYQPDFTFTVSCSSPGSYQISMTDLSNPKPLDWHWDFGDGNISTLQNPIHNYDSILSHTINFVINTSIGCKDTVKKTYTIPKANFTNSIQLCPSPFQGSFTNISSGSGTFTYAWDFGDGSYSNQMHPVHTFKESYKTYSYSYPITLIATNQFGCADSITIPLNITKPQAEFKINTASGCAPLPIQFNDISISSEPISSYAWNFGDLASGPLNTSAISNPSHIFNQIGTYKTSMVIHTLNGCIDTVNKVVKAGIAPDHIDFLLLPSNSICHHSLMSMIDISSYTDTSIKPDYWCWTARFDPATPTWHSDVFNWISCSDTGFSDPHNILATVYNNSHIFDQYNFSIKPVFTSHDTLYITNYKGIFGRDTIGLITGYNGCNDTLFKEVFINGPSALSGFVLKNDTALALCMAPDTIGFFNASLNWTKMNSFQIVNKNTNKIEANILSPTDTTYIAFHKAGVYGIKISVTNDTSTCSDNGYRELVIDSLVHTFAIQPKVSCFNNNKVQFTDLSSSAFGQIRNWYWDFGDGNKLFSGDTVYGRNPLTGDTSYTYTPAGNYKDSVVKADSHGGFTSGTYGAPSHTYKKPGKYVVKAAIVSELHYMMKTDWQYETKQCTHILYDTIEIVGTMAHFTAQKKSVCTYDTVKFIDQSVSSGNILSWTWDFGDGSSISNVKNPTHKYAKAGIYSVKLKTMDNANCNDSILIQNMIQVNAPIASFTANPAQICAGDTVTFSNTSNAGTTGYTWIFDDNSVPIYTKDAKHVYTKSGSLNPSLIVMDMNGCKDTAYSVILIAGKPRPAFKADTLKASCPPFLVQFTDTSSAASIVKWRWDFGDGSVSNQSFPAHLYSAPGNYDVKLWVANQTGCADSLINYGMISIGGPSGTFTFSPDSFCAPSQVLFNFQIQNTDFLFMDYGDGDVTLFNAPQIPSSQSHSYAKGGVLTPQLILKDQSGCTVIVPGPGLIYSDNIQAAFSTSSDIFCSMDAVSFANTSNSPFATSFLWNFDDGTTSTTFSPNHLFSSPGSYDIKLSATTILGCTSQINKKIKLHEKPGISIMMRDTNWCVPLTLYFSANNKTPLIPITQWLWDFGDGNTAIGNQAFHTFSQKGIFDVKFHAEYGNGDCSKDSSIQVGTRAWPTADFKYLPTNPAMNNPLITFTDLSTNAISWHWDFGNGDTSQLPNPTYSYNSSGTYQVKLLVKNIFGCADSMIKKIFIADEAFIKTPNAFSPNNDGVNDKLFLFFSGIESLEEYKIFNRWGEIVYESKDLKRGWDGTYNGMPQDEGTFTYYIVGRASETKKKIIQNGTFTLIR